MWLVITYTTSMRKRLRNEKKGILVDISNMEVWTNVTISALKLKIS